MQAGLQWRPAVLIQGLQVETPGRTRPRASVGVTGAPWCAVLMASAPRLSYRGQRHEDPEREYLEVHHPIDERVPRGAIRRA